jgi:hypothetical protein
MAASDAAAAIAAVTDDMLSDQLVPVSQGELAAEEAIARGFVAPQMRRRVGGGGDGAAALAAEVRDLGLPVHEYANWAENHQAVGDHASIEARTRSMFAPVGSPEARERRLLRDRAAGAPAASAAPAVKPSGQSADRFVAGLSDAQREALEASLLDRRAADWGDQAEEDTTQADATPAYELEYVDYATDAWLTETVEESEAA